MSFRVGDIVDFGRPNGEKTRGEVTKINRKSLGVKTMEARGRNGRSGAGRVWRVHPSLCTLVSRGGAPVGRQVPSPERTPIHLLIPQQPQRQDSVEDQLRDLAVAANKLGMYDAADFIRDLL